jgi:hypothetical protein
MRPQTGPQNEGKSDVRRRQSAEPISNLVFQLPSGLTSNTDTRSGQPASRFHDWSSVRAEIFRANSGLPDDSENTGGSSYRLTSRNYRPISGNSATSRLCRSNNSLGSSMCKPNRPEPKPSWGRLGRRRCSRLLRTELGQRCDWRRGPFADQLSCQSQSWQVCAHCYSNCKR